MAENKPVEVIQADKDCVTEIWHYAMTPGHAARIVAAYRHQSTDPLMAALREARGCLDWLIRQAGNAMSVTGEDPTTHSDLDPLEEANRYASDIEINCRMLADKLDTLLSHTEGEGL